MRLLIVTQALDLDDSVLSVYHGWVAELAKHFEYVEVICLKEGRHELPENIRVHSLGKETGTRHPLIYAARFLILSWQLRNEYDAVFVHMNQEYILIAGWLWKLLGKRMYMWRNHYAGSWLTDIAAAFCTKVFCTSRHSYTAKYKKTVLMPVGVDTKRFKPNEHIQRKPHSILFLARMSPSKRPDILIGALALLAEKGTEFTASLVGSPLPRDRAWYEELKKSADLISGVQFHPGVANTETSVLYSEHEFFVNASRSGMYDKTIFEALACGSLALVASKDYAEHADSRLTFDGSSEDLALKLGMLLAMDGEEKQKLRAQTLELAKSHSLEILGNKIAHALI